MSKVITFSTRFPAYHPKAGQPTHFVEKLWRSWNEMGMSIDVIAPYQGAYDNRDNITHDVVSIMDFDPKHHTIRNGKRWKAGETFSPRVWSDKPYASRQIAIGPDITISRVADIEIQESGIVLIDGVRCWNTEMIAKHDGLDFADFQQWFTAPSFSGQILIWNDSNLPY